MNKYVLTFLICLIPAALAFGHDVYLFTQNPDRGFLFSDMGYVWTTYEPNSYRKFIENAGPDMIADANIVLSWALTVVMLCVGVILPILVAFQYFLLRVLFGWIGGKGVQTRKSYFGDVGGRTDLQGRNKGLFKYSRK